MGIITIRTSERNGEVIGIAQVVDDDQVMLITNGGKVLRCRVATISTMGRATQGVRLMELGEGEALVAMARLAEEDTGEGTRRSSWPRRSPEAVPLRARIGLGAPQRPVSASRDCDRFSSRLAGQQARLAEDLARASGSASATRRMRRKPSRHR